MKNWKRRYFVLDENSLNYYKTDMVRKRWRAQTRWHQCSKTHHVAPKQTLKKKRVKKICACCKTYCVSPHAEACVLNTSSCHLRVDRLALTTACLCTYMGTPRVCVCVRTYMCVWLSVHTFLCVIMSWVSAAAAEDICLHAIAADCESYRPTRSSI